MGPDRRDDDGTDPVPGDRGDIADAYAPPAKAHSRALFVGIIALVAVCVVVFLVARALG